jgi:hypothetical protein
MKYKNKEINYKKNTYCDITAVSKETNNEILDNTMRTK